MSKFNDPKVRAASGRGPVVTERTSTGPTHQGAPGYGRDPKSELFLLAVTNMVAERTFYETPDARDERFETLVHECALADPVWTARMLRWLRTGANVRTAPLVGALELVKARLDAGVRGAGVLRVVDGDERGLDRRTVDAVLQRADEPGEALAYWMSRYGRAVPKPVKRGIADAARRLYTQRSTLRYDTASHGVRFGDVLELTHPAATSSEQGDLFRYLLDRRHGRDENVPASLSTLRNNAQLRLAAAVRPGALLHEANLQAAGMSWEEALSLAGDRISKRELWEALADTMGYMALLRNLRNMDEAGVSDEVAEKIARRLADPDEVARSRQLPLRFLSAYRAAPSLRWSYPLERALNLALGGVSELQGRTLVLVDTSTSMNDTFSQDGTLKRWDAAVLFGAALARRAQHADLVSFSSTAVRWGDAHNANTRVFDVKPGESLLRTLSRWEKDGYFLGGGTATRAAVVRHLAGHDRVVILTDEQAGVDHRDVGSAVPPAVPLYTWNLAGYEKGHAPGGRNRWTFGGLTDAGFRLIPLLESGRNGVWPWEDDGTWVATARAQAGAVTHHEVPRPAG